MLIVDVVIPALNEERAIGAVLDDIPEDRVRHIVVCDNASTDRTAEVAERHGAIVVREPERGYGAACLRALDRIAADPPDVVVFLDGDRSDYAEELPDLVAPIEAGRADLVIGSRALGVAERGSLTLQQRAGNRLASFLLERLYGQETTDLGPFRAIRWTSLARLEMRDRNYGWTVEMQIKAAKHGLRVAEVPVRYRVRIGESKVSGTIRGTLGASRKILWTIARHAWR